MKPGSLLLLACFLIPGSAHGQAGEQEAEYAKQREELRTIIARLPPLVERIEEIRSECLEAGWKAPGRDRAMAEEALSIELNRLLGAKEAFQTVQNTRKRVGKMMVLQLLGSKTAPVDINAEVLRTVVDQEPNRKAHEALEYGVEALRAEQRTCDEMEKRAAARGRIAVRVTWGFALAALIAAAAHYAFRAPV